MGEAARLCATKQEEGISTEMSVTEYAEFLCNMKELKVAFNDVSAPAETRYQLAIRSTRPCVISDFPGRAVAANVLHVSEQVNEKRSGGERRRVANQ